MKEGHYRNTVLVLKHYVFIVLIGEVCSGTHWPIPWHYITKMSSIMCNLCSSEVISNIQKKFHKLYSLIQTPFQKYDPVR